MDIVQQITQSVGVSVQQAYQHRFSLVSTAASLANLPNWRLVLKQEFDTYVADMRAQEKENKNRLEHMVPPEQLIQARGAVSDAVDAAIVASGEHYTKLIATIERLTADCDELKHNN